MDGFSGSSQELRDDGSGGGLAVAAGYRNFRAGADLKKDLHLTGEEASSLHCGSQLRQVRPHPRSAKDHVLIQSLEVVLPQAQAAASFFQLLRQGAQGLPALFVTDGDIPGQQQLNQGLIGDADANDGYSLIL